MSQHSGNWWFGKATAKVTAWSSSPCVWVKLMDSSTMFQL